ncbi:MAG: hypothetical protein OEP48_02465 [Betaproteobacteria bacterium]|nr:hypothetical protein [Betaproteobacteria bacterium]MDH3437089.1 hypothetical protein [Betaproteobacteria bacterium]
MSGEWSGPETVSLVDRQRTPVAGGEFGAAANGGHGNQRVVCGTAGHPTGG